MENDMISLDAALKIYGGADDNKKAKIIIEDQNNEEIDIIQCLPYVPSISPIKLKQEDGSKWCLI